MSKTIKIILIFLVVAGVIGAGIYFGTKTSQPTGTTTGESLPTTQTGEQTGLPSAPTGTESGQGAAASGSETTSPDTNVLGAKVIYKEPVLGFSPMADGGIMFVTKKGVVASISSSGKGWELNNSEIENPIEVIFSNDNKKILLTYGQTTAPQFSVYDVASSTWQPILANVSATIRPKTHEIVYLYEKLGTKNLFVWDLDKPKTTPQQISSLQIEDPVLSWRDKDTLLISGKSSAYIRNTVIAFSLSKKTATPLITDKYGLSMIWNDAGTTALGFYGNDVYRGGNLRLYLSGGEESSKLTFLTLPEKCSFIHSAAYFATSTPATTKTKIATSTATSTEAAAPKNELYCAFPRDTKALNLAILPDEYYRGSLAVSDDLVKISLEDGSLEYVYSPTDTQMDMYKPFAGETSVYFINRNTGILYSVPNK